MSGVEIRQRAASEGQRGSRRGQEGWPARLIGLAGTLHLDAPLTPLLHPTTSP